MNASIKSIEKKAKAHKILLSRLAISSYTISSEPSRSDREFVRETTHSDRAARALIILACRAAVSIMSPGSTLFDELTVLEVVSK